MAWLSGVRTASDPSPGPRDRLHTFECIVCTARVTCVLFCVPYPVPETLKVKADSPDANRAAWNKGRRSRCCFYRPGFCQVAEIMFELSCRQRGPFQRVCVWGLFSTSLFQ